MGRLYKLAYQLRIHLFGEAQQDIVARNLAFFAALVIILQWLLRGRPGLPAWHWVVFALILLFAFGLIALRNMAARAMYVVFAAQPGLPEPSPLQMEPEDKEATLVTGRFEVEGKEARLANLTGYWRTFGSREHALMAVQHASRFLLGSLPPSRVGMWYIFFHPHEVQGVKPGTVTFGATRRPGLQITYRRVPPSQGKKPMKPFLEPVYLAFETEASRDRVWADLLADAES